MALKPSRLIKELLEEKILFKFLYYEAQIESWGFSSGKQAVKLSTPVQYKLSSLNKICL